MFTAVHPILVRNSPSYFRSRTRTSAPTPLDTWQVNTLRRHTVGRPHIARTYRHAHTHVFNTKRSPLSSPVNPTKIPGNLNPPTNTKWQCASAYSHWSLTFSVIGRFSADERQITNKNNHEHVIFSCGGNVQLQRNEHVVIFKLRTEHNRLLASLLAAKLVGPRSTVFWRLVLTVTFALFSVKLAECCYRCFASLEFLRPFSLVWWLLLQFICSLVWFTRWLWNSRLKHHSSISYIWEIFINVGVKNGKMEAKQVIEE